MHTQFIAKGIINITQFGFIHKAIAHRTDIVLKKSRFEKLDQLETLGSASFLMEGPRRESWYDMIHSEKIWVERKMICKDFDPEQDEF